ncbi:MAG: RHS repeat-associated core domain-containing protein, partial [Lautropia sp.]|nr:RHS repeat-associated core domain-containing protein [Lautropia sp.]
TNTNTNTSLSLSDTTSSGDGAGADSGEVVRSNAQRVLTGTNRYEGVPYDAVGRPLRWQGWQIRWHAAGQIESLTDDQGRRIEYFHNHRGERVARLEHGEWRFYDYQDGRLQAERRLGVSVDAKGQSAVMRTWWYEGEIPVLVMSGQWRQPEQRNMLSRWLHRVWSLGGEQKQPNFSLYWLHVDHHALPLAVTDSSGQPVWRQRFGPFGEPVSNDGSVDPYGPAERHGNPASAGGLVSRARANEHDPMLRFPGQWVDETTGLYYNMMRDYDPSMGRYLSPDPLGLRAGPNPYLYVNGDPVRNIDPTGLLLFAFDGTLNAPDEPTNVWFFSRLYQHQGNGPNPLGSKHRPYLSGIGIVGGRHLPYEPTEGKYDRSYWEVYYANYWRDNVEFHIQQFRDAVNQLKAGEKLDIDVVGFSRGASQATEFGRLVARELRSGRFGEKAAQVNLRFMGLMDPVPTNLYASHKKEKWSHKNDERSSRVSGMGFSGRGAVDDWEQQCQPMKVDDEWDSVVNILASHDRRNTLFKAASLGTQVNESREGMLREEFAMVGAHSDIGGGYMDGDLSDVALWALIERAKAAGVQLSELPDDLRRVDRPIAHIEQWGMDLNEKDREFLVDGVWKRQGESGVRGISVSKEEVGWEDTARNEIATEYGAMQRDRVVAWQQSINFMLSGSAYPDSGKLNRSAFSQDGRARESAIRSDMAKYGQAHGLEMGRDDEILSKASGFKPIGTARIDMQKYCAYLLREKILQKCPY